MAQLIDTSVFIGLERKGLPLAALSSILGGVTVTHKMSPTLDLNLGFTLQSQTGKDGITLVQPASGRTPAGSTTVSAADLDVTTITAGFTWRY